MQKFTLVLLGLLIGLPVLSRAQVGAYAAQGKTRLSLSGGYGSFNDRDYLVLGLGAGYYLLDGLEAGVDGEAWVGSSPHFGSVSPGVRYVLTQFESIKPYVGGFYKRSFYDKYEDKNSVGGRAGIISALNERTYLTLGAVYEHQYDCNKTLYDECDFVYPEIGLAFSY